MSRCSHFTLRQAIAWIIWRDADRPLRLVRPEVDDGEALRSWWDATADTERRIRDAAGDLAEKISTGNVPAAGWRVSAGPPWSGSVDAEYVDQIPASTAQHISVIPIEWLELSDGGCLLLKGRMINGADCGTLFCRVTVDANAVKAAWPDDNSAPPAPASDAIAGTGAPGRPSKSMHLIEDQFDRRAAAGIADRALAKEANELLKWLETTHPKSDRPTPKTIQNRIRPKHRQYRSDPPDII